MNLNSIVPFIKEQFPDRIAETKSLLIPFMEAYYEWMQLDNNVYGLANDISKLYNIDDSLAKFSEEFDAEYLSNFPKNILTDKSLTIKHINDLYKAKGTPKAVKLLVRILLGKDSEIFYPSTQVLKVSDGTWIQENSIYVSMISGNIFDTVGQSVKISTSQLTFTTVVEKVKLTDFAGIYEVFIEKKLIYDISPNTLLSYNNVLAKTEQTIVNCVITSPGNGFAVGQLFELTSDTGRGTFVKIKSVSPSGGIKALEIIKFGFGFRANFTIGLLAKKTQSSIVPYFPIIADSTDSLSDSGFINKVDYSESGYFLGDTYYGDVLATFQNNTAISDDPNSAKIQVVLGDKIRYPGYYNSVNGFLSDAVYLQDNFFYQSFSYVIKLDDSIDKIRDKIISTVHPVGTKLFSEYTIKNSYQVNTRLKFILNFFRVVFAESINLQDAYNANFSKFLSDIIYGNDATSIELDKYFTDTIINSDASVNTFIKNLSDTFSSDDASSIETDKNIAELINSLDSAFVNYSKILSDTFSSDDATSVETDKYLSDFIANSDASVNTLIKGLSDIFSSDDASSIETDKAIYDSINSIELASIGFTTAFIDSLSPPSDNGFIQVNPYYLDASYIDSTYYDGYTTF